MNWGALLVVMALAWPIQYGGQLGYTVVAGTSMVPAYRTGDLVITKRHHDYSTGQIVVYAVPKGSLGQGHLVVHRLIAGSDKAGWTTKGDNNPSHDIWAPHNVDIKGVVFVHIAKAGFVLHLLQNPLLYALLGGGVIGVILWPRKKGESVDAASVHNALTNQTAGEVDDKVAPTQSNQRFTCAIDIPGHVCALQGQQANPLAPYLA